MVSVTVQHLGRWFVVLAFQVVERNETVWRWQIMRAEAKLFANGASLSGEWQWYLGSLDAIRHGVAKLSSLDETHMLFQQPEAG